MKKIILPALRLTIAMLTSAYYLIIIIAISAFTKSDKLKFRLVKGWGRIMCKILGVKISINDKTIPNGVLVLPNHRSWLDIPLIFSLVPAIIISKKENASWPIIGQGLRAIEAILVDRSNMTSLIKTFKEIAKRTKENKTVILFPEGTINKGPKTGRFKNGAFRIAAEQNIHVVPIAFEYQNREVVWDGNESFITNFFTSMSVFRTNVKVNIGDAITSDNEKHLHNTVKQWMDEKLVIMYEEFQN